MSNNLKRFRTEAKLSQATLARRSGVSVQWIATLEQSGSTAGQDIAAKLGRALNLPASQLFPSLQLRRPHLDRFKQLSLAHPEPVGLLVPEQKALVLDVLKTMPETMFKQLLGVPWATVWTTVDSYAAWIKQFTEVGAKAAAAASKQG